MILNWPRSCGEKGPQSTKIIPLVTVGAKP